MDFGFNDPMTLVISFIEDGVLYIQDEVYYTQVTPKDFVELADKKLGADWRKVETIADESQPAVIKELSRSGIKIRRSEKGAERGSGISKSSIINGIERLKAFDKIVIHKSCKNTIEEFQNYSFKTERATGIILDEPQDNYNHCIDALRYSLLKYRH
jgi:phage terminase large subunit